MLFNFLKVKEQRISMIKQQQRKEQLSHLYLNVQEL